MGFAKVFPDVAVEYGVDRKLDIRCGFSKAFISEKLHEHHTSQIWFKKGNNLEYTFNFGCSVMVGNKNDANPL